MPDAPLRDSPPALPPDSAAHAAHRDAPRASTIAWCLASGLLLLVAPLVPDVWSDGILRWAPRLEELLLTDGVRGVVAVLGALLMLLGARDLAVALVRRWQRR